MFSASPADSRTVSKTSNEVATFSTMCTHRGEFVERMPRCGSETLPARLPCAWVPPKPTEVVLLFGYRSPAVLQASCYFFLCLRPPFLAIFSSECA